MKKIIDRIKRLRLLMAQEKLDAWYISGTDPHISEYPPERWCERKFITGFTGSYGEVVVTTSDALLWTDTRYFIQAEDELRGTGIKMQKLRVPDAVPFEEWLVQNLNAGARVGVNPECLPLNTFKKLKGRLAEAGIELVFRADLVGRLWENRPPLPQNEVFELDVKYTGLSRSEKFDIITKKLNDIGCDLQIITALDDLAWTFNLRGSDVLYNPVFVGFGIIGEKIRRLFVDHEKLPSTISEKLKTDNIQLQDYNTFYNFLGTLSGKRVLIDPVTTNLAVFNSLPYGCEKVEGNSVPALMKALKNNTELEGFRVAMRKDGVALVKFLFWIKNNIGKIPLTEYNVAVKLAEFRSEMEGFRGESFSPIVGYREHGAVVHFSVSKETAIALEARGLLLVDSGGHYLDGTTDITRTIVLGPLTQQEKHDFTLILKGLISLTEAKFPFGTKGHNLDILARQGLWQNGLNYGHGTGHGVGHYLSVHEGPAGIRQEFNPQPIEPGMVLSNEPGIYREGEYGIRIENMMVCVEREVTGFGQFLGFETLTLCPIDLKAVDPKLLNQAEKEWINLYHRKVRTVLGPFLNRPLKRFLEEITPEIK